MYLLCELIETEVFCENKPYWIAGNWGVLSAVILSRWHASLSEYFTRWPSQDSFITQYTLNRSTFTVTIALRRQSANYLEKNGYFSFSTLNRHDFAR